MLRFADPANPADSNRDRSGPQRAAG